MAWRRSTWIHILLGFLALGVLVGGAAVAKGQYTFTTIDLPGSTLTIASGISNFGEIVGEYLDARDIDHGFLLSAGSYTTLDVAASASTSAKGINSKPDADIVGLWTDASRYAHSYLLSGGVYTKLDDIPGSTATYALGINAAGQIVGGYLAGSNHGFLRMSDGSYRTIDVPGSTDTQAEGINDLGQIVGRYLAGGTDHGFLLSGDSYTTFDVGLNTEALGINDLGQMVGSYLAGGTEHGFVRMSDGSYMTIDVPGLGTRAIGINDSGEIVGQYIDARGVVHGFVATPIPEPSTLLLLAISTVGVIGWTAWRRPRAFFAPLAWWCL